MVLESEHRNWRVLTQLADYKSFVQGRLTVASAARQVVRHPGHLTPTSQVLGVGPRRGAEARAAQGGEPSMPADLPPPPQSSPTSEK